jgi:SAM-dependent methyltransferase
VSVGVDWGTLRRTEPVSRRFGFDRGKPVDRHYIERFLGEHAADVKGRVLEIGDRNYTRRFGGERVTRSDVYDRPGRDNPAATLRGDLEAGANLPAGAFDCLIVCQTLLFVYHLHRAMRELRNALAPGGVLLMTVPGVSQIVREDMNDEGDYWRFTTRSLGRLAAAEFEPAGIEVKSYGSVLTCVAFLEGLAVEDLRAEDLAAHDPDYQLIVALRAVAARPTAGT